MTALLPNRWYRLGFCLLLGVFVFVSHGYAIELNKLQVQQLLSTQDSLLDISFVVMIDSILSVYFCVARLGGSDSSKVKRYMSVLRYMPSLLVFPAVFYIHVNLFFSIVATDFMLITSGWALFVVLLFVVASLFMRRLFAEKELPIEIILILVCAYGVRYGVSPFGYGLRQRYACRLDRVCYNFGSVDYHYVGRLYF